MTTAQPGQEQRMDSSPITREEMVEMFGEEMPIEAVNLVWNSDGEKACGELRAELRAIAAARPTADLGEDGELIATLPKIAAYVEDHKGMTFDDDQLDDIAAKFRQARDRLILYREALEDAAAFIRGDISGQSQRAGILRELDAVLLKDRSE